MVRVYEDRSGKKKVITTIMVDAELLSKFKRLAADKFGANRGFLSSAIEEAMKLWIATYPGAHLSTQEEEEKKPKFLRVDRPL